MKTFPIWAAIALISVAILSFPASAADIKEKVVIYQTDFSKDPRWTTNNPRFYYWDPTTEVYHYHMEGGTNGYAFKEINYSGESFELEFDVFPNSTPADSAFRFGVGNQEMDVTRATNVLAELMVRKNAKLMGLRVISQNNNMAEVTSQFYSYCGATPNCETKEFTDGVPYHVIMRYNKELQNADIKFLNMTSGETAWGYYTPINQELSTLDRLVLSSKGEYQLGIAADGWIDNVTLSVIRTKKEEPTIPPTTATPITTSQPTTISTTMSTPPTTTKSPAPLLVGLAGIAAAALITGRRSRRP